MFCKFCGKEIGDYETLCPYCQKELGHSKENGKDWLITFLLCLFFGVWGLHRFYTGNIKYGIFYILCSVIFLLCGVYILCIVLPVIDLILLITNKYKDCQGNKLNNFSKTTQIIIVAIFLFYLLSYISMGVTKRQKTHTMITQALSSASINYLKSSYSDFYQNKSKNIVFYIKNSNSPVEQEFADKMNKYSVSPYYNKYYNFANLEKEKSPQTEQEIKEWKSFKIQCESFCIVNTQNDEIASVRYISQKNINKMYNALNKYKDW